VPGVPSTRRIEDVRDPHELKDVGILPDKARARTIRQFVEELEQLPEARFDGYLRRSDFSRWIGDVFGGSRTRDGTAGS
jgi:hypothetical protein